MFAVRDEMPVIRSSVTAAIPPFVRTSRSVTTDPADRDPMGHEPLRLITPDPPSRRARSTGPISKSAVVPGGPLGPRGPTAPVGPSGPGSPVDPDGPAGPGGPIGPRAAPLCTATVAAPRPPAAPASRAPKARPTTMRVSITRLSRDRRSPAGKSTDPPIPDLGGRRPCAPLSARLRAASRALRVIRDGLRPPLTRPLRPAPMLRHRSGGDPCPEVGDISPVTYSSDMQPTEHDERNDVGWCHQCGTMQLQTEMPRRSLPWTDGAEPVCVECGDEPWGTGVGIKGNHVHSCTWTTMARSRTVDWAPSWPCTCGGRPAEED